MIVWQDNRDGKFEIYGGKSVEGSFEKMKAPYSVYSSMEKVYENGIITVGSSGMQRLSIIQNEKSIALDNDYEK